MYSQFVLLYCEYMFVAEGCGLWGVRDAAWGVQQLYTCKNIKSNSAPHIYFLTFDIYLSHKFQVITFFQPNAETLNP